MKNCKLVLVFVAAMLLLLFSASFGSIYLKSGTVITGGMQTASMIPSFSKQGAGYYLISIKGPVHDEDKQTLVNAGAEIIEYVPDNAFIVRVLHSDMSSIRRLSCVEWVGPFKPEYKSRIALSTSSKHEQFLVILFPGKSQNYLISKAKLLGAKDIGCSPDKSGSACRIIANKSQLAELANSDAVAWIEPYVQPQLCNDVAAGIMGVPEVRQNLGLFGKDQLVGIADAGLDTGNINTISADFSGRIAKTYTLRRPGEWNDLNGHGTHVTGSFIGSGALSGSNPVTHSYNNSFAGTAPEAQLVFQSIGDSGGYVFPPLHLGDLFQPVYNDGVRVHSNSWGNIANGEYTVYSNEVDQFIWDHKDFTAVFAVGNEGRDKNQNGIIDLDTLLAPSTAKNCISVGATENLRLTGGKTSGYGAIWAVDYPAFPINNDLISNNISGMAAYSGRGPTDDGRIKPDICAPGTNIVSCRTHATAQATGWAAYDANYIYWGGTSMSTPLVAGAAALVREYYQREKEINPSAALVKATLISGATDIYPGQYGNGGYREVSIAPDFVQGWGRLNAKTSLFPDPPLVNEFTDESAAVSTGEFREYQYSVINNTVPFKATLVWTDYPGAVHAAKELVNDLDLTVTTPSGHTYPVMGSADHLNNVEQVKFNTPEIGVYTVRVTGNNIAMGPQDYALVVSGGLPNTYISGTVKSTSGAGVSGVLVTIISSAGVKRVSTNLSGKYITHVSQGQYSLQLNKPGWTFTPPAKLVDVAGSPVENVDFQGQGSPGGLSGKITRTVGGVVNYILESPHPYINDSDNIYTITGHDQATKIRVHFAEIGLMNDGDAIMILDANDNVINTYTGLGEDIWSSWVDGNVIKIELRATITGNTAYGFFIDGYETDLIQQGGLGNATISLSPGGYQTNSLSDGTYSLSSIPPGTYTVTPSKTSWKFQPDSKTVDVPAGAVTASGNDFSAFPPGIINGEIKTSTVVSSNIDVESEHNYQDNFDQTWQIDANPSATRIRLHFSRLSTEAAFDFVTIFDGANNSIETYTGDDSDFWTPWMDGSIAQIELYSDEGTNAWGFKCDKYEAQTIGAGLAGVSVQLSPDGRTAITSAQGTFSFSDVVVGDHKVTPTLAPWTFDPSPATASISAGIERNLFFFANMGDLTKVSQAKLLSNTSQITLKGAIVSAAFNGFFYIQDSDRIGGIRVVSTKAVTAGKTVDVTGTMGTVNGERKIDATSVTVY